MRTTKRRAFLLLIPAFILYTLFVVYPYVTSFLYSLTDWIGVGEKHFIGFQNYVHLFTERRLSSQLWQAFSHNMTLFGVSMLFTVGLGLTFAFLLSSRKLKGRSIFRAIYFIPYILPALSVGFIWRYIFQPRWGALNEILNNVGLSGLARPWLGDLHTAFPTVVFVWCLRLTGLYILFFQAAILSIPDEYRDAARVDGCTRWQEILYIEIPLLKPTILKLSLLNFIGAFGAFGMIAGLTGLEGAPFGKTDVLGMFFYRTAFGTVNNPFGEGFGMGAAVAWVIAVFLVAVSFLFQMAIQRSQVEY